MERDTSILPELVVFVAALVILVVIPFRLLRLCLSLVVSSLWRVFLWLRCELNYWLGVLGQ